MAMNGNEGGSAYPPNPDVKSGSCLIAGFHALSVIRPSYWNAYRTESGATFSIDMVRLKLSFINGKREVKSVRKELGALAAEAQQMRKSGKQLESERASGRPESRSKGVDR